MDLLTTNAFITAVVVNLKEVAELDSNIIKAQVALSGMDRHTTRTVTLYALMKQNKPISNIQRNMYKVPAGYTQVQIIR
jgi:hypothetical protein